MRRFVQAISCLPPRLQSAMLALEDRLKAGCEEIRLRAGRAPCISMAGHEELVNAAPVSPEELRETLSRAARYSVHSYGEALKNGFVPLEGGHRLGVCGAASVQEGHIAGIRVVSSLNLRVAGQAVGSADAVLPQLFCKSKLCSALIISPPGYGKTTLLRDLLRQISESGTRVAVADERGELAALHGGIPQFDVGPFTDILDGCPKAEGVMTLIKTMSPEVVALDEVTAAADVEAVAYACHCGVTVLATAHAADLQDLKRRPLYQKMLACQVFARVVEISRLYEKRQYQVHTIGGK